MRLHLDYMDYRSGFFVSLNESFLSSFTQNCLIFSRNACIHQSDNCLWDGILPISNGYRKLTMFDSVLVGLKLNGLEFVRVIQKE